MEIDMEYSFDECVADDNKFIALVVSSSDEDETDTVSYSSGVTINNCGSRINANTSTSTSTISNHAHGNASQQSAAKKSPASSHSKKRWSLMSNHSHGSFPKKRWSMLSSFTMDSTSRENTTKRIVSTSAASQPSNTNNNNSTDNISNHNSNTSRTSSMKRSSTGASLKHLFNKISIIDKEVVDSNKENNVPSSSSSIFNNSKKQVYLSTIIPSTTNSNYLIQKNTNNNNSFAFRTPLKPLNIQSSTQPPNTGRNRRSLLKSNRNSIQTPSIYSQSTDSSALSNSNSSSSKWKFWKKSSTDLPKSISTQSLNTNKLSQNNSNNTLRSKTSFTDFHMNFFSTDTLSTNSSNTESRKSVHRKQSSSSLSQVLKHKTSHTSLQKHKSRRKSNAVNDDGSSFISSSSGNNSMNRTNSSNIISLPIPDEVSREKIRAKLKNSTSLLSLNSATPINQKQYDETILNQILDSTTVKYVLTDIDFRHVDNTEIEILTSTNSIKLTDNVWRMISTRDSTQTIICKKLSLDTDSKTTSYNELKILNLVKGTPGLPVLLQSYVHKSSGTSHDNNILTLYLFFKDHGTPLESASIHSWSQCLNIFWQCASILYVTEIEFKYEHRNLTVDHILIDHNGNVTLCDMETCRAEISNNYMDPQIYHTRLDNPIFYQSKKKYAFDMYQSMRSFFNGEATWNNFEPKTNLLWLRYIAIMLLGNNTNGKVMGPGRDQLNKLAAILEYSTSTNLRRNALFKRKDIDVKCTGDLMRFK